MKCYEAGLIKKIEAKVSPKRLRMAIDMSSKCVNPYCNFPDVEMRLPTEEELHSWKSQADQEALNQFKKGKITLMICQGCGVWTVEIPQDEEPEIKRCCIPSPFRYQVGERLRVILEGKTFGMIGTAKRRERQAKLVYPPPVPENYYTVVLEGIQNEVSFREDHLEPIK